MTTTTAGPVLVDDDAAVRTVTLNRPQKRNAIDIELRIALAEAIESADRRSGHPGDHRDRSGPGVLFRRGHLHHAAHARRTRTWSG